MWKDRSKIKKTTPKQIAGDDWYAGGSFRHGTPPPAQQFSRAGWTQLPGVFACPMPGSEDGIVYFERNGVSAYWDGGKVYVKSG